MSSGFAQEFSAMSQAPVPVEAEFTLLRKQIKGVKLRKSNRYRFGLATICHLTYPEDGRRQEAWAGNLSETGIGFYLEQPIASGTDLVLRLKSASGAVLTLEARVVHSTKQMDDTFCIGCTFSKRLDAQALDDLLK
jgi:hypothetical protein